MREIKFRAWDEETNEMIYQDKHTAFEIADGFVGINCDETKDYYYREWSWKGSLNCVLMQFTGLKDKNGKEIYEGDIVNQVGFNAKGVVRFGTYKRTNFSNNDLQVKHHGFYFEPITYADKHDVVWNKDVISLVEDEERGFEIIGNIYENPELYKVEE